MKLIKEVLPPCDCAEKAEYFRNGRGWRPGTQVECDCGALLQLTEHQFDGIYWHVAVSAPED